MYYQELLSKGLNFTHKPNIHTLMNDANTIRSARIKMEMQGNYEPLKQRVNLTLHLGGILDNLKCELSILDYSQNPKDNL